MTATIPVTHASNLIQFVGVSLSPAVPELDQPRQVGGAVLRLPGDICRAIEQLVLFVCTYELRSVRSPKPVDAFRHRITVGVSERRTQSFLAISRAGTIPSSALPPVTVE